MEVLSSIATLASVLGFVLFFLNRSESKLEKKIDELSARSDERFAEVTQRMDQRFLEMVNRMETLQMQIFELSMGKSLKEAIKETKKHGNSGS